MNLKGWGKMRSDLNALRGVIKYLDELDDAIITGIAHVENPIEQAKMMGNSDGLECAIAKLNEILKSEQARDEVEKKLYFPIPVKHDRIREYNSETPLKECFMKIFEEYMEAYDECMKADFTKMTEELQDIIHVCVTTQELVGCGFESRQWLCKKTNEKNAERGYFK